MPLYPSSPRGTKELDPHIEMDVWDAGYEAASYVYSKGENRVDPIGLFINSKDSRVPAGITETDPQFWEYLGTFVDGVKAFAADASDLEVI